jgi:hypothetical protein
MMRKRKRAILQNRLVRETMTRLNESSGKGHALDRSVVVRHDFGTLVQLTCTNLRP